jgi:DNA-binding NtrC family response regulator
VLAELRVTLDRPSLRLAAGLEARLLRHAWPGNVRELRHVVTQAALREDGPVLSGAFFEPRAGRGADSARDPAPRRLRAEQALADARGNKSRAAAALRITRKTLYQWLADGEGK